MSTTKTVCMAPTGRFPVALSEQHLKKIQQFEDYHDYYSSSGFYPGDGPSEHDFEILKTFNSYTEYKNFVSKEYNISI